MNDANKYVNTYIEFAVNQLHENLNNILQLKTQVKIANDLASEKDGLIAKLTQELETNKADNQEIVKIRDQARKWEDAHNAVVGKVAHLDTALSQISQMKAEIVERDKTIQSLKDEIQLLKNPLPKKSLNNKVKKEATNTLPQVLEILSDNVKPEKQATDDF